MAKKKQNALFGKEADGAAKPAKKKRKDMTPEERKKANETWWQAFKYLCCTASAGVIQFVSFTIMTYTIPNTLGKMYFIHEMDVSLFISTTVALALSVLWNFTLNRKFTFKSAGNVPRAMTLAFLFYVPFYPFQTWYVAAVAYAINPTAEWAKLVAEFTVMLLNGIFEFCWQKFVIYRKDQNTAVTKKERLAAEAKAKALAEADVTDMEVFIESSEITDGDIIKKA